MVLDLSELFMDLALIWFRKGLQEMMACVPQFANGWEGQLPAAEFNFFDEAFSLCQAFLQVLESGDIAVTPVLRHQPCNPLPIHGSGPYPPW
jgi:hypothetical protein